MGDKITKDALGLLGRELLGEKVASQRDLDLTGGPRRLARRVRQDYGRVFRLTCGVSDGTPSVFRQCDLALVAGVRIYLEGALPGTRVHTVVVDMASLEATVVVPEVVAWLYGACREGGKRAESSNVLSAVEAIRRALDSEVRVQLEEVRAKVVTVRSRRIRRLERVYSERFQDQADSSDGESPGGGELLREKKALAGAIETYFDPEGVEAWGDIDFLVLLSLDQRGDS
jgi:hypothetical protein